MPPRHVTIRLHGDTKPTPQHPKFANNAGELLRAACKEMDKDAEVVKASFINGDNPRKYDYIGAHNGLIMTVLEAYTNHRNLVLHHDDIEFVILAQIAARRYHKQPEIKAQAEQGYKIHVKDTIHPDNYDTLAKAVLSTLTPEDHHTDTHKFLKSVLAGAMKPSLPDPDNKTKPNNLFRAGSIPSVTLLGEKSAWEELMVRIEDILKEFEKGDEGFVLYRIALLQLFKYFAMSFDAPTAGNVQVFWNHMCSDGVVQGWIAVLNWWDAYGEQNEIGYDNHVGIHTGDIMENRVSPGYRLLDFHVDHGTDTNTLVKFGAGSVGIEFLSEKSLYPAFTNAVRPASGIFMLAT